MKKIASIFLFSTLVLLTSCKKTEVDSTSQKTFQSSVNDMASSLSTLEQIKFNEALYILKTFGVEAEGDSKEMEALRDLLSGKKVPEILSMADQVAQENAIDWSSTGTPSLGEMNIFDDVKAKESDSNEIVAASLDIIVKPNEVDVNNEPSSLKVIPRLVDKSGNPITFEGATLETVMEVFSNGSRLTLAKNLMLNNNFGGFNLRFRNLPADKVFDDKVDITVSVKTTEKTYKMSKIGVPVNAQFLKQTIIETPVIDSLDVQNGFNTEDDVDFNNTDSNETSTTATASTAEPKRTVERFLNGLGSQNLKAAYNTSANPNWGSYEKFSNPNTGFGGVKQVSVKKISPNSKNNETASVNASYDITDKNGNVTPLNVTFGLKNVNGEWKISSYKIN